MKMESIVIILLLQLSSIFEIYGEKLIETERGLLQDYILQNYNRNVRPVADRRNPHHIQTELFLISLDDFDMKRQTVKSRMFIELKWKDEFLNWDPAMFSNTTRITIDSDFIWVPDLIIGNEEGPFTFLNYSMIGKAIIESDGMVTIWPYLFIEVGSRVEVTDYPFDEQSFHFRISSWGLTTKDLIMQLETTNVSYSHYQESGEWEIKRSYTDKWNRTIGKDSYSRVAYFVTVRRKSLYYILNVIGPLVVTAILNTMCFILPVESAQRVTLSVSIFLSLAIFLTIITETQPRTSDGVSVIVIYLCFQIWGSLLTIAMNVIILNIYHKNESKKKSLLLQSMLQMSRNMRLMGWKTESRSQSMEIANREKAVDRKSNGHAITSDTTSQHVEQTDTTVGGGSTYLQPPRNSWALPNSASRSSFAEERRLSVRFADDNDNETKRKIPEIRKRSIKSEETIWTARAHYLNTCSFWFSLFWNIGLILLLIILPRV